MKPGPHGPTIKRCAAGHPVIGDNALQMSARKVVCRTCYEQLRVIRPQHGQRYRIVTADDRVVDQVVYDANLRVFRTFRTGLDRQVRVVQASQVVLLAKRIEGQACGGEQFCRVPEFAPVPEVAA